ncbi:MAG: hypothetical protein FD126_27 [Elusimicrobia bacterium]|nr:MAG: hypothetical protein FD126_27 [Elusimicrobiota bacterium]
MGIGVLSASGLLFALVPFWEKLVPEDGRDRAVDAFGWASLAVLAAMTAWGHFS